MKGKFPSSIITDGDIAMRNAIKRVFSFLSSSTLCMASDKECDNEDGNNWLQNLVLRIIGGLKKCMRRRQCGQLPIFGVDKGAKSAIQGIVSGNPCVWDIVLLSRYVSLLDIYMQLARVGSKRLHRYNSLKEKALAELAAINDKNEESSDGDGPGEGQSMQAGHGCLNDPPIVRSKGSKNLHVSKTTLRSKRPRKCRLCNVAGHNRATCPFRTQLNEMVNEMYGGSAAMIPDNGSFSMMTFMLVL
ncbi:hypothetical protein SESBI_11162 [Sesbania bispinosa]|nr:hypothetical protein SESBI_11162 [Sesbania bispinosa]